MLTGHEVETAHELDWSRLKNGEPLDAAEREGFSVFVTTDANLKYQQILKLRDSFRPSIEHPRSSLRSFAPFVPLR